MYPNSQLQFTVVVLPSDDVLQTPWLWHVELEHWDVIRVSQVFPVVPPGHEQEKEPSVLRHKPPLQGSKKHSSSSILHCIPDRLCGHSQKKPPIWLVQRPPWQKLGSLHSTMSWSQFAPVHPRFERRFQVCDNIFLLTVICLIWHFTWFFYKSTTLSENFYFSYSRVYVTILACFAVGLAILYTLIGVSWTRDVTSSPIKSRRTVKFVCHV